MTVYRPDPAILALGPDFYDPVAPADFPQAILRFRNDRAAAAVGLDALSDDEWVRRFARFEALLDNLPEPPTNALLAELNSLSVERRFAAAKALGRLCHGQTLPTLKRMIETGNHQREALAVLSECSDSAAAAYVRQLQRHPALAIQLNAVRGEMEKLF